jgi:ectoine hydroxylase-related dioxygenase (phytanoyl-CoA dioxygenase family)
VKVDSIQTALVEEGWLVTPPAVPPAVVDELISKFEADSDPSVRRGGVRGLLARDSIRRLISNETIRMIVEADLGAQAFACRSILFDKTPEANWKVTWHQDLTIAVSERVEQEGFGPWSVKDRTPHVQAPPIVLERMLAVRVHLDDCAPHSGPVQVLPGSHRSGRLTPDAIDGQVRLALPVDCIGDRGSVVAFKPLLLHRSSQATQPKHRRIVHIEFASAELPGDLDWSERVYRPT